MNFHSPPIFCDQSCLTDTIIVIFLDGYRHKFRAGVLRTGVTASGLSARLHHRKHNTARRRSL